MKTAFLGKRGSIFDVLGWLILIPVFIIAAIAIFIAYANIDVAFTNNMQANPDPIMEEQYNGTFAKQVDAYPSWMDFAIVLLVFGIWITLLITSYLLGNNPVFLIVYIFMMGALLVLGIAEWAFMSDITENSFLAPYFAVFPMTLWIINYFLWVALFVMLTTMGALYMKLGGAQ